MHAKIPSPQMIFNGFLHVTMKVLNSYEFIYELAEDAKEKTFEWENTTISEYLESIVGWIEDTDEKSLYPVEWDKKI